MLLQSVMFGSRIWKPGSPNSTVEQVVRFDPQAAKAAPQKPLGTIPAVAAPVPQATVAVLMAEPVPSAVGPIVVPAAAMTPFHAPQPEPESWVQPQQEAPSPAPVPSSYQSREETPSPAPDFVTVSGGNAFGSGKAGLLKFLQSVRCEQYMVPLTSLGASEVLDLRDMEVCILLLATLQSLSWLVLVASLANIARLGWRHHQ
jgi:hypothetical protein